VSGVNSARVEKERGQVEDQINLELGQHAFEERRVGDGTGELPTHERRQVIVEPGEIDGDDGTAGPGQPRDETVSDLATGSCDQGDRCPHICGLF
jgi:hypothetical protein